MMKKIEKVVLIVVSVVIVLLVVFACIRGRYLFTNERYELCDRFSRKHTAGMTKQEVYDILGCPDGYTDGKYYDISHDYEQQKFFGINVSEDKSTQWYYHGTKGRDLDITYHLYVTFDSEGKTLTAEIKVVASA